MANRVITYMMGLKIPFRYQARAVPRVTEEKALVSVVGLNETSQGLKSLILITPSHRPPHLKLELGAGLK
jgi:hypothetical protein